MTSLSQFLDTHDDPLDFAPFDRVAVTNNIRDLPEVARAYQEAADRAVVDARVDRLVEIEGEIAKATDKLRAYSVWMDGEKAKTRLIIAGCVLGGITTAFLVLLQPLGGMTLPVALVASAGLIWTCYRGARRAARTETLSDAYGADYIAYVDRMTDEKSSIRESLLVLA